MLQPQCALRGRGNTAVAPEEIERHNNEFGYHPNQPSADSQRMPGQGAHDLFLNRPATISTPKRRRGRDSALLRCPRRTAAQGKELNDGEFPVPPAVRAVTPQPGVPAMGTVKRLLFLFGRVIGDTATNAGEPGG